eukprot:CAMPEP_0177661650 /NCGR_PEP_ID=MMETSP0447-20121125/18818_1 /TAXON_ID=0 /ORGANISM="Stygamoeba regulata, Strain BSH-02190019" /LENGTH=719 /DNA_ID=CAMNT_0019167059 /DNA_START=133 /DNA_END=2292 /DNA_ORIENTATION=+
MAASSHSDLPVVRGIRSLLSDEEQEQAKRSAVRERTATEAQRSADRDDQEPPELSGWLQKRGAKHQSWRQRFFRLENATRLVYYEKMPKSSSSQNNSKGYVQLTYDTHVLPDQEGGAGFVLRTPSRAWILRASSLESRDAWVMALNALLAQLFHLNEMPAELLDPALLPHSDRFTPVSGAALAGNTSLLAPPGMLSLPVSATAAGAEVGGSAGGSASGASGGSSGDSGTTPRRNYRRALTVDLFAQPEAEKTVVTEMDEQRMKVAKEILQTEETYVNNLRVLLEHFKAPVLAQREDLGLSAANVALIFGNCELLLEYNMTLLTRLREADEINTKSFPKEERSVGEIFVHMVPLFKAYSVYVSTYNTGKETLEGLLKSNKQLASFLVDLKNKSGTQMDIHNFIMMPIQRIPRYKMLLNEMLRNTAVGHRNWNSIREALVLISEVAVEINKARPAAEHSAMIEAIQAKVADSEFLQLVQPHRQFVCEGFLEKTWEVQSDFTGKKEAQSAYFWLFNDLLLYATPIGKNKFRYEGFFPLENAVVFPGAGASELNCICLTYPKKKSSSEDQSLAQDLEPHKLIRAADEKEALFWINNIRSQIEYVRMMPEHILAKERTLRKNDAIEDTGYQGFLTLLPKKKKFHFQIKGTSLFWFSSPMDKVPLGSIQLGNFSLLKTVAKKSKPLAFWLYTKDKKKRMFLLADELTYPIWVRALSPLVSEVEMD